MDETEPIPPLGEETHSSETEYERGWRNAMNQVNVPEDTRPVTTHWLDPYEKEASLTRRFYLLLLGLIVIASLIATIIVALDDDAQIGTIAAVLVIGGVATGALASLAAHDRR